MKPFNCFAVLSMLGAFFCCFSALNQSELFLKEKQQKEELKSIERSTDWLNEELMPTCKERDGVVEPYQENIRYFMVSSFLNRSSQNDFLYDDLKKDVERNCLFGKERDLFLFKADEYQSGVYIEKNEGKVIEVIFVMKDDNPHFLDLN